MNASSALVSTKQDLQHLIKSRQPPKANFPNGSFSHSIACEVLNMGHNLTKRHEEPVETHWDLEGKAASTHRGVQTGYRSAWFRVYLGRLG